MSWYRYVVKGVEVESGDGLLGADVSGDDGVQVAHPDQVVGGSSKGEGPADSSDSTITSLAQPAHGLEPVEYLLDPFAPPFAEQISRAPVRATTDPAVR